MTGFLARLEKRRARPGTEAQLLLKSGSANLSTNVVTGNITLGSADAMLADLKSEGEQLRKGDSARTSAIKREEARKVPDALDDSLPWWLSSPVEPSMQVSVLVPTARNALNELINEKLTPQALEAAIKRAVNIAADSLSSEIRFSGKDLQDSIAELKSLLLGKGPLQPLYDDPAVTDIYMDRHDSIKCLRRGQALETPFKFRSVEEYESYLGCMLQSVDRVLNMSSPIVDCVLGDQWRSRVSAVHSSILDGKESSAVVRIPRLQQISFYDLLRTKTLPATLAAWLAEIVSCGEANILVMGPSGSGKTTLTTALLSAVASDERVCTIEDVPELFVPSAHLEKLVCRPANAQGEGAVTMEDLLRAALRRAPHRIVVGEIRDREGPLFLKALETGHAGSVATIHAENPRDGLWRLQDLVSSFERAPQESIQRRIARSIHVVIAMKRVNGRPCMVDLSEVESAQGGDFQVRQIVRYEGEVRGKRQWRIMQESSYWLEKLKDRGMELVPGPALLGADA